MLLTLVFVLAGACGSKTDESPEAVSDVSTTLGVGVGGVDGHVALPEVADSADIGGIEGQWCPSRMPDELIPAGEANVYFTATQICPGYLTVLAGDPIKFTNQSSSMADITIETSEPVIADVGPGEGLTTRISEVGQYQYRVSAIPDFRGIIEVRSE